MSDVCLVTLYIVMTCHINIAKLYGEHLHCKESHNSVVIYICPSKAFLMTSSCWIYLWVRAYSLVA